MLYQLQHCYFKIGKKNQFCRHTIIEEKKKPLEGNLNLEPHTQKQCINYTIYTKNAFPTKMVEK